MVVALVLFVFLLSLFFVGFLFCVAVVFCFCRVGLCHCGFVCVRPSFFFVCSLCVCVFGGGFCVVVFVLSLSLFGSPIACLPACFFVPLFCQLVSVCLSLVIFLVFVLLSAPQFSSSSFGFVVLLFVSVCSFFF